MKWYAATAVVAMTTASLGIGISVMDGHEGVSADVPESLVSMGFSPCNTFCFTGTPICGAAEHKNDETQYGTDGGEPPWLRHRRGL